MTQPTRLVLAALLASLLAACAAPPTSQAGPASADNPVTVDLGTSTQVATLFSFPNCLQNCPVPPWTLEQTVQHWMAASVTRDGYSNAKVSVSAQNGHEILSISGVPADYGVYVQNFMQESAKAAADVPAVQAAGKWQSDWSFFEVLGMPLRNQKTVQLLHFPPDTVKTTSQDYMQAATTQRWASLLVMNGVASTATDSYQRIMDIAPIAAPASAGKQLEGVYDYFNDASTGLIQSWTAPAPGTSAPRAMVAMGGPARAWLSSYYKLPPVNVLTLTSISPKPGQTVPVLGGNHPSLIWYASDPAGHGGDVKAANEAGKQVMLQDLTVACWQANMGQTPAADPTATLNTCTTQWQNQQTQVCVAFFMSIRKESKSDAEKDCQ
ncbi:hypothetical protein JCM19000A_03370 [Silvimonas sp. JCM 19000]